MSKSPVPFAPETLETIQRAFRLATDLRHDTVGLEHLLIAIADEPQARRILVACGADVHAMKGQLRGTGEAFTPCRHRAHRAGPTPSTPRHATRRWCTPRCRRHPRRSGSLLVFILREEESRAYFLRAQGIDRLTLLRVISHGTPRSDSPAVPATGDPAPPAAIRSRPMPQSGARAAEGLIDPLIGRTLELEWMIRCSADGARRTPLLVSEPGVGKASPRSGASHSSGQRARVLKDSR
jgi:ATP-dependent Clp protease ATP-binding subunit ClpA